MLNRLFQTVTFAASIGLVLLIAGMFVTLWAESLPAFRHFGFVKFLTTADWNYANEIYGALRPLTGTIISTLIALAAAVPIALGTAIFLTEVSPHPLRGGIGMTIELLAAIPSIIYGMWGLFVFAPFLDVWFQPLVEASLGRLPLIGSFFQVRYAGGANLFTAGMVLAVMIMPFIASITRDAFLAVPAILKESSYGLGSTKWETIREVVIPYCKTTIAGGVIIAMGRALGETMAVAYVVGSRHGALDSIFSPYNTITSVMANEFNEASGLQMSSLFALALVLLLANFMVLSLAKYLLRAKT
ncbi:MAG: phosphate ABC transporter permease subunit PstC [Deltaproteobacteria bacterium]|nr:phosphate ABC transporter permease subunit PstC [Deltaproteobacteria bacterium]